MADHVTQQAAPGRTQVGDRRHPVHVFTGRVTAVLDELADASLLSLGLAETVEVTGAKPVGS